VSFLDSLGYNLLTMANESNRKWSEQQNAIFNQFANGTGNVVVRARAGTGKTTTIIEGISYSKSEKILLAAFNKKIAEELKFKLKNPNAEAKTLHSIGFGFILRNWSGVALDNDRGDRLARTACGPSAPDLMVSFVKRLAAKGKNMLLSPNVSDLVDIAYMFDLDPDETWEADGWTVQVVAEYAAKAMQLACSKDGTIDFDDMVYIPVANKWVRGKYDLVVIDEAQDMNAVQIALAQGVCKKNGRVFVVGDDRQAIYGFRGADSNVIDRLKSELKAVELGLTVTYRCPQVIVNYAKLIVPDYMAAPTAPLGEIVEIDFEKLHEVADRGNFVLSRKNAPLAKVCLRLLRHGKRAMIEGKEIGNQLISIVKKVGGKSIPDFMTRIGKWEEKQIARLKATGKKSAEAKIEVVRDQSETLRALAEGMAGLKELTTRITSLFTETPGGKADYIICSSVHKSKGLETDVVFVLHDTLYPGGFRSQEEQNIEYVAVTRAKQKLVWVNGIS